MTKSSVHILALARIMFFMSGSGEKQLKIEKLNINVYQDVCRKLNIPNSGRDYKTLAGELGYNTEKVKEFEQEKNPAGAVLSHWGTESGNTVNKLIEILKRMENDVVAEKLEQALELSRGSQGEQDLMEVDHTLPWTEEESNAFVLTGRKRSHESDQSLAEGEPSSKKEDETVAAGVKDKASDTDKKPFFVRDLDSSLKSKICQLLNEKSVLKRDFRGLAAKMKFEDSEIELFEQCDNPTATLLKEWGTGREATVENLIKLLEKMKRDDVVDMLKEA